MPCAGQLNEAELQAQTLAATLADVERRAAADAKARGAEAAAAAAAAADRLSASKAELAACRLEVLPSPCLQASCLHIEWFLRWC